MIALTSAKNALLRRFHNPPHLQHGSYNQIPVADSQAYFDDPIMSASTLGMNDEIPAEAASSQTPIEQRQNPSDKAIEKRLNKKMDFALLPFLSLLYLFNGLDRSNIGNAETQGMCIFTTVL